MTLTCDQGGDRVPWDGAAAPLAASYLGPSLVVVAAALWGNGKCGVLGAPGKMLQEKVGGGGLRLVPSHRGLEDTLSVGGTLAPKFLMSQSKGLPSR